MGLGGISPWSLLLILGIVLLLFGTKKLKGLGGDLGGAIKGFKSAMSDDGAKKVEQQEDDDTLDRNLDTKASEQTADTSTTNTATKDKSNT